MTRLEQPPTIGTNNFVTGVLRNPLLSILLVPKKKIKEGEGKGKSLIHSGNQFLSPLDISQ
jgi:hypothetical protein